MFFTGRIRHGKFWRAAAAVALIGGLTITGAETSALGAGTPTLTPQQINAPGVLSVSLFTLSGFTQIQVYNGDDVTLGTGYQFVMGDLTGPGDCYQDGPPGPAPQVQCAMAGSGDLTLAGSDASQELTFDCSTTGAVCPRHPIVDGEGGIDDIMVGGITSDGKITRITGAQIDAGPGNDDVDLGKESSGSVNGGTGDDEIQVPSGTGGYPAAEGPWDITCGPGNDTVIAGPNDTVADDCETVHQAAPPEANLSTKLTAKKHALGYSLPKPLGKDTINSQRSTYTVVVHNPGSVAASNVRLTAAVSKEVPMTTHAKPSHGNCTTTQTFTCKLGNLGAGKSDTVKIDVIAEGKAKLSTALSKVHVVSDTGDPVVSNNKDSLKISVRVSKPIKAKAAKKNHSRGPLVAAKHKPFPGVTTDGLICNPEGGNGTGTLGVTAHIAENGKSGTTHFTLEYRLQVRDDNFVWQGGLAYQISVPSSQFPDDSLNYSWPNTHTFWLAANTPPGALFRMEVQGKWIHDRGFPHPNDKVLHKTGWSVVGGTCKSGGDYPGG